MTMDAHLLDEAANWLVRLNDRGLTQAEHAAFERWRHTSPAHEGAWLRAELLMGKLAGLPSALAMPALDRSRRRSRRAAVTRVAVLLAALPGGWVGWRVAQQQGWAADLRTGTGEQRSVTLADGSRLRLDTSSAVDIRFDAHQRLIHLRRGSILVETAPDPDGMDRPLLVATVVGRLRALGTRFSVQQDSEGRFVDLAVTQGAVEVTLYGASRPELVVPAGSSTRLTARGAAALKTASAQQLAWAQGMLVADAMPMAEVCARLARYHSGLLHCAPEVMAIKVSGAYPLADTDRALAMLAETYAVSVHQRWRGYWITVVAR
jgi:transmembrane sensor